MVKKLITIDPKVCHGKPCIKGTRVPVAAILDLITNGYTFDRITKECYPQLDKRQIRAALKYATSVIKNERVVPLG